MSELDDLRAKLAARNERIGELERAIREAGYFVEPTSAGRVCLWCKDCKRDGGYHRGTCSSRTGNMEATATARANRSRE